MYTVTVMLHTRRAGAKTKPSTLSETVRRHVASVVVGLPLIQTIALALAMSRDGSSGGVIRMCVITEDGVDRLFVPGDQLPRFWEGKEVLGAATGLQPVPAVVPMVVEA